MSQRVSFDLVLYDDEETYRKLEFLSKFETAFDHTRNAFPDDYYTVTENIPIGSKIRIQIEIIEN